MTGEDFETIFGNFRRTISGVCKELDDLLQSDRVDEDDRMLFSELKKQKADAVNTVAALDLICRMLHDHYGKQVFVLIDEYDVPMGKALGMSSYEKVRDMIERMLSFVCKTNEHVKAVMLSGCLFTVKNSTYTGVNNVIPYTVLSPLYASYFGFTDKDVKKLLSDTGFSSYYDTVREWYDGYLFGRERIYCPWDVLRFVNSLVEGSYSEIMGPENYWANTSEMSLDIVRGFFGKTKGLMENFEKLLAGQTIDCIVSENLPYHRIHESGENIWSALLETGYLTKAMPERMQLMPVRIPNMEIQDVFRREVAAFFLEKVDHGFIRDRSNILKETITTNGE